jgi:putative spermidine/putrescine transport system permease protein
MTAGISDTLLEGRKALPMFALFRLRFGTWWLALPLLIFFFLFVLMPITMLSVASISGAGGLSLANYERFFTDGLSLPVLGRTLLLGLETAMVALLLGYPLALLFVAASPRFQKLLILLIILPLLTSSVVRTFAWVVILGRQGLINEALIAMGMVNAPVPLLYTEPLLVLTLAQIELPLMTLPIISVLSAIDPHLKEASIALGAGRWRTLVQVVLPLSLPGVIAGLLLVFAAACSALVTQSIVGGGRLLFVPLYIYQQGMQGQNWPFAAAISLMLLISVLAVVAVLNTLGRFATRHLHV